MKNQDKDAERRYQKLLAKPLGETEGISVEAVRRYGEIQYYAMKNNKGAKVSRVRELYDEMVRHGFIEKVPDAGDEEKESVLQGAFGYMNL